LPKPFQIAKFEALARENSAFTISIFFTTLITIVALHAPFLKLAYFWDELGQFIPAALDLYHHGSWVPISVPPNVHPPAVMLLVALIWKIGGYSIALARVTMLTIGSVGVFCLYLLTSRFLNLSSAISVIYLVATPIFYTQSMLVILDMPAMTFTLLALLLFLGKRYVWCAAACTVLVLLKETAITTPLILGAYLWLNQKDRRTPLYFFAPIAALSIWLLVLKNATGYWLGNAEFTRDNVTQALTLHHFLMALVARLWFLFASDGRWIGTIALFAGRHLLRGTKWNVLALVAVGQVAIVTILGGAELDRYLLPALPIVYAAMATATAVYSSKWRWISNALMILLLLVGWFWNPPYPYPYENNLTMMNFVALQQDAAKYLETAMPNRRIASVWPFTFAVQNPELGYVNRTLKVVDAPGLRIADLKKLNRRDYDLLVVYNRYSPIKGTWIDVAPLQGVLKRFRRYYDVRLQATDYEIRTELGFIPLKRWTRNNLWIEVYGPIHPPN